MDWCKSTLAVMKAVDHAFVSHCENGLQAHHCDLDYEGEVNGETREMHHDKEPKSSARSIINSLAKLPVVIAAAQLSSRSTGRDTKSSSAPSSSNKECSPAQWSCWNAFMTGSVAHHDHDMILSCRGLGCTYHCFNHESVLLQLLEESQCISVASIAFLAL